MKAIILTAGEGTRMRPLTTTRPKTMLITGGKPLIQYNIESLRDAGIKDITLVVGYKKEVIEDYFGDGSEYGVNITYAVQEGQLGTAHAIGSAEEYIDDSRKLGSLLRPGRLIIVDLRDEFIDKDDALGLFVIMLNIFAGVKEYQGIRFNKFIVFDEAHKYMDNKELTSTIVTAIREMRHKGVSMMIASQDPMSLPTEIIELSSIMLMHKFNSPQWVKHVQKSITQLQTLSSSDMATLMPGEAYLWATKSTDKGVTSRPMKISTRPRVTKHGGDTIKAV